MDEADVKFLQAMVEHHNAALEMARRYLSGSSPARRQARVAELARNIITAQTAEIATMRGWLRSAGKSGGGSSSMKGM